MPKYRGQRHFLQQQIVGLQERIPHIRLAKRATRAVYVGACCSFKASIYESMELRSSATYVVPHYKYCSALYFIIQLLLQYNSLQLLHS